MNVVLNIGMTIWVFGWLIVFFLKGYTEYVYPMAKDGVSSPESIEKTKQSGCLWMIIAIIAEASLMIVVYTLPQ